MQSNNKILFKRGIHRWTQHEANKKFLGSFLSIESKYSQLVQVFWCSFVFGTIAPVCIIIGPIIFAFYFVTERMLFHQIYSIPPYTGLNLSLTFINSLPVVIMHIGVANLLIQILMAKILDRQVDNVILIVCITNIVLGGVFYFMPWDRIFQKCFIQVKSDPKQKTYSQKIENKQFELTYEDANPAITKRFNVQYNQKQAISQYQQQKAHQPINQKQNIQTSRKLMPK